MTGLSLFRTETKQSLTPTVKPRMNSVDSHAEEDVVLWTDSQTLSDGTQLSPDVSAQDVGGTRGRGEQSGQDGPAGEGIEMKVHEVVDKVDKVCLRVCIYTP